MANEKDSGAGPDMASANTVYRQLVAAGASAEIAEATQWLLELFSGVEPVQFDPEGADALAAELGTPGAVKLRTATELLAAEFEIAQVDDLCALLQQGIVWSKALQGKLAPATINGQPGFSFPSVFDREKELIKDLNAVLDKLHQLPIARDMRANDNLIETIEVYRKAYKPYPKKGKGANPHPGYGIIAILAFNYKYLTGKELHNVHSSKAAKGGRGPFFPSWLSNSRIQLSVNDSSAFPGAAASYGHAGDRGDAAPCHRPTRDPAGRGGGCECVR